MMKAAFCLVPTQRSANKKERLKKVVITDGDDGVSELKPL